MKAMLNTKFSLISLRKRKILIGELPKYDKLGWVISTEPFVYTMADGTIIISTEAPNDGVIASYEAGHHRDYVNACIEKAYVEYMYRNDTIAERLINNPPVNDRRAFEKFCAINDYNSESLIDHIKNNVDLIDEAISDITGKECHMADNLLWDIY